MDPTRTLPGTRIVVVEDDPVLLGLLGELLEAEGCEVIAHSRAADAHLLVRNVQPGAVILDLCLADGSDPDAGWRVLDRLVLDPATRDIPVVVASGAVESIAAHRIALQPQHGLRVLLKPYALGQLLGVLVELVGPRTGLGRGGGLAGLERLTPRQREIARLIALGYTNRQIAARLVLEEGSVANHVAHILERLGTANRAQVAAWAAMHGLVDGPRTPEDTHVA